MLLGVNIDHIAVLKEARKIHDPDPLMAVEYVAKAGADQITIPLREDRRHINDFDAERIIRNAILPVNLECSADPSMIEIACRLRPHRVTLVPERREEVTTEGGLDLKGQHDRVEAAVKRLVEREIDVSLFIDPTTEAVEAGHALGVSMVELHTGFFANVYAMRYTNLPRTPHAIESLKKSRAELDAHFEEAIAALEESARLASDLGVAVAAGHGLNYQNVPYIRAIEEIEELNIGQSIVARSVFTGIGEAVREMIALIR